MRLNRDFTYKGWQFHLNDNRHGISKCNYEFFPKYKLMLYDIDRWEQIAAVNTKKEAMQYAKQYYYEVLKFFKEA